MSPRVATAVLAGCAGACLALLAYRLTMVPRSWRGPSTWALELGGAVLVGLAWPWARRHLRTGLGSAGWLGAALAGGALAWGGAALLVGTLADVPLRPTALPGASIALPAGKVAAESLGDDAGHLELVEVADTDALISVRWEPGEPLAADEQELLITELARALQLPLSGVRTAPGAGAAPIATTIAAGRGKTIWLSTAPCGARVLSVITVAQDSVFGEVHRRVVATLQCPKGS